MSDPFSSVFFDPRVFYIALVMAALVMLVARHWGASVGPRVLIAIGSLSLAVAAGQPFWARSTTGSIAVMVDLSPSTRGAIFRDRAALNLRIHQLLGNLPFQAIAFSDRNHSMPAGNQLQDLPADQTIFAPPKADAVLLFSDGQFALPTDPPPTYPVIDPVLNHPADASVTDLKPFGAEVLAEVQNENPTRTLKWTGAVADPHQPLLAKPTDQTQIAAGFSPGDLWPENDSLALNLPPHERRQTWWVGVAAPTGWRSFSPDSVPTDAASFLQPAVIVLNNIPADALSSAQQQNLLQYVRDLGGSLLIVGGDHAYAAGHYDPSMLETLSPLSSSPPLPTQEWLLLIDGSGSMAGDPWQTEIAAISRLIPQIPPHDRITVGSFARSVTLWPTTAPPPGVGPNGPTNLAAALEKIIATSDGSSPTQLILMTDADTQPPDAASFAPRLNEKKIHLHLLAIGQGKALPALKAISTLTGGSSIEQLDAHQWIASATQLLRSALPDHYQHTTISVTPAPPVFVSNWNQTWLKPTATTLQQSSSIPITARWQLGLGRVISMAYPADPDIAVLFAKQIAAPPRDPRFKITCDAGASLRVTVDAVDDNQYLNGQAVALEMNGITTPLPQTAPGEYQITLPAPRTSQIVAVRNQSVVLERFAVAGRYPAEFNAIGNNLENLKTLAAQSGGSIIEPGPARPIDFHWPVRQISLLSEFAFAGFVTIAAGMILNRRSR